MHRWRMVWYSGSCTSSRWVKPFASLTGPQPTPRERLGTTNHIRYPRTVQATFVIPSPRSSTGPRTKNEVLGWRPRVDEQAIPTEGTQERVHGSLRPASPWSRWPAWTSVLTWQACPTVFQGATPRWRPAAGAATTNEDHEHHFSKAT